MLRAATAILLLAAFTLQSFSKLFLVLNYYANNAAYAKQCVNKAVPLMNCNGQCLLMKKIQAEQTKEQKNPELKLENKNEVYALMKNAFASHVISAVIDAYPLIGSIGHPADFSSAVFRPPLA